MDLGTSSRVFCLLAVAAASGGCAIFRGDPPPNPTAGTRLVEVRDGDPSSPDQSVVRASLMPRRARIVLAISGGGMYGAYSAGVLRGWSEAGTRPAFDVVTGVSTGALIAPFAFLGPDYDDLLEKNYTECRSRDIYRKRLLLAPLWSDSVADPLPLRHRIRSQITPELLDRLALAHAEGRRLYVGTTNLDTRKMVVWDLGAIASRHEPGRLDLIHRVILASCAVPGFFPPVPIEVEVDGRRYTELHADGGVAASLFLLPEMVGLDPGHPAPPAGPRPEIRVIVSGKLDAPSGPVRRSFLGVSADALDGVLQSQQDGDLIRMFLLARHVGADFRLTAVPPDLPVDGSAFDFDPGPMRRLFDAGRRAATSPSSWRTRPPGLLPEERPAPRGGARFLTETAPPEVRPSQAPRDDLLRAARSESPASPGPSAAGPGPIPR